MRNRQRGLTFLGLLVVGGLIACIGVVAAQAFPTVIEYQAVQKAVTKAAREGTSVIDIRKIFDRAAAIDDITSIAGKDLDISKEGDKVVVTYAYNREIPVAGPVFLVIKYAGRSR